MSDLKKKIEKSLENYLPKMKLEIKEEVPMNEIQRQNDNNEYWEKNGWRWCDDSGIYYFRNDSAILYIGKAAKFGERIAKHLKAADKEWWEDIRADGVVVGFIPTKDMEHKDLEQFLIEKLNPRHNIQHNR